LLPLLFAAFCFSEEAFSAAAVKNVSAPAVAQAKPPAKFEVSGWIPYWRKMAGVEEAIKHMDVFTELSPFNYAVKDDGTLLDLMKIKESPWTELFAAAREKKVRIIPTVSWANTAAIEKILKSKTLRAAHIRAIVEMVKENNFDGVDIDYESKTAATRPYFSAFLRELYAAMGKKFVVCTIEPRTPLTARFDKIPKDIEYANDYDVINGNCDRVRVMTYDQGAIDLRLNKENLGPYIPVSDPRWVEKVIELAAKNISRKKLVVGIPTYGYEYEAVKLKDDGYRYNLLWAFNPKYALDLASQLQVSPVRNSAGEISFMYVPSTPAVPSSMSPDITLSHSTWIATTTFSGISSSTAVGSSFRILWWSDPIAVIGKMVVAKSLGVRGVAVFKIDGAGDGKVWEYFK